MRTLCGETSDTCSDTFRGVRPFPLLVASDSWKSIGIHMCANSRHFHVRIEVKQRALDGIATGQREAYERSKKETERQPVILQ
jgi:hypothetical protein